MLELYKSTTRLLIKENLLLPKLSGYALFNVFMNLKGSIYRDMPSRITSRVEINHEFFFIKQHFGVGWKEILKNLLSFKKPVLSARNELIALEKLEECHILSTPLVAYGESGLNPATRQSFLMTRDLGEITSLETLCMDWGKFAPNIQLKRSLIKRVADLAKKMHSAGLYHRDFYICHLCLKTHEIQNSDAPLYLMDLHRAELTSKINVQNRNKDLAALYFSALHIGLTKRDILRFIKQYFQSKLTVKLLSSTELKWIEARALKLDEKFRRKIAAGKKL